MDNKIQPSTPQSISKVEFHPDDQWVVVINRTDHILNGMEAEFLKKVTENKSKGIVWFSKFAISLPFIQEIYRKKSGKMKEKYGN